MPPSPVSTSPDRERRDGERACFSRLEKGGIGAAGLTMLLALAHSVVVEGDTTWVLVGADEILRCLAGERPRPCRGVGQWPLLQFLPALPLAAAGVALAEIGKLLAYLSIASFVGLLVVTWRCVGERSRVTASLGIVVLVSGELVYYANRSFGEMTAAFLGVCLVAACLRGRRPGQVGLWAFLCSLTKESSFPFLALLGGLCLIARDSRESPRVLLRRERASLAGLASGLGLGLAATLGMNLFRFGVPHNVEYLGNLAWTGPLSTQLQHLAALWIAPNVGFVFFWPLFVLVLATVAVLLWRDRAPRRAWLPLAGTLVVLALLSLFLARWWAPYGWWAWGSRLILPWVPPVLLLLLWSHAERLEQSVASVLRRRTRHLAALAAAGVVGLGLPHLTSAFRSEEFIVDTFMVPGVCSGADHPSTRSRFFECLRDEAWINPSPLLFGYEASLDPRLIPPLAAYAILVASVCVHIWRAVRRLGPDG